MTQIIFIDIDGTVTDGAKREQIVNQKGLVIGEYGDPDRKYPLGKHEFLMNFNHKDIFHLDETLPYANELINTLAQFNPDNTVIFWLTARDVINHEAIKLDLDNRGLWFEGMRLICKPHATYCDTVDYKIKIIQEIVSTANPNFCLYVENESRLCSAAVNLGLGIKVVENCIAGLELVKLQFVDYGVAN